MSLGKNCSPYLPCSVRFVMENYSHAKYIYILHPVHAFFGCVFEWSLMCCEFNGRFNKHKHQIIIWLGAKQKSKFRNWLHSENHLKLLQGKSTYIILLFLNRGSPLEQNSLKFFVLQQKTCWISCSFLPKICTGKAWSMVFSLVLLERWGFTLSNGVCLTQKQLPVLFLCNRIWTPADWSILCSVFLKFSILSFSQYETVALWSDQI